VIDVDNSVTDVVKYPFLNIGGVMANQYKDSRLASFTVGSVSGVYMITDTVTNRTYIGSSTNIRNRLGQHLSSMHNNEQVTTYDNFSKTYHQHGASAFNIKVLIICAKENLKFYEASCIGALNPTENTMKRNDGRIAFTDDADTWVKINPTTQQSGNLNISGGATTSIIAGLLSVGNAALENTSTALRVITGSATNLHVLGASSRVYLDASSDDRSTAKPMYLTASEINMNNGVFHLSTNGSIGIGTNSPSADAKIEIRKDVNITANNYSAHMRFAGLTNPSVQLNMGFDTLSNTGFLQATNNPTSFLNLSLSPLGGNVAVALLKVFHGVATLPLAASLPLGLM